MKNKMLPVFISVSAVFSLITLSAFTRQKPDWVDNNGVSAQYPDRLYKTGYGVGKAENFDYITHRTVTTEVSPCAI